MTLNITGKHVEAYHERSGHRGSTPLTSITLTPKGSAMTVTKKKAPKAKPQKEEQKEQESSFDAQAFVKEAITALDFPSDWDARIKPITDNCFRVNFFVIIEDDVECVIVNKKLVSSRFFQIERDGDNHKLVDKTILK